MEYWWTHSGAGGIFIVRYHRYIRFPDAGIDRYIFRRVASSTIVFRAVATRFRVSARRGRRRSISRFGKAL
jgi:hypothetical protein